MAHDGHEDTSHNMLHDRKTKNIQLFQIHKVRSYTSYHLFNAILFVPKYNFDTSGKSTYIYEGLGDNASLYVKNDYGYYGHAFANI